MATHPGPLSRFPWQAALGEHGKWVLVALPLAVTAAVHDSDDRFALHMLGLALLSYVNACAWDLLARRPHAAKIQTPDQHALEFRQLDRERHWDEYIWLRALFMLAFKALDAFQPNPLHGTLKHVPVWGAHGWRGLATVVLLHMGPTEFTYYWAHRLLHHHTLFSRYHSHHHASFVTQPWSGTCHPFLEHVVRLSPRALRHLTSAQLTMFTDFLE
jgi:sterol desaturase/sphingolipid hydroxylase (fatty acid hydroxylase superfamily)